MNISPTDPEFQAGSPFTILTRTSGLWTSDEFDGLIGGLGRVVRVTRTAAADRLLIVGEFTRMSIAKAVPHYDFTVEVARLKRQVKGAVSLSELFDAMGREESRQREETALPDTGTY